jgi:hypothetical protein
VLQHPPDIKVLKICDKFNKYLPSYLTKHPAKMSYSIHPSLKNSVTTKPQFMKWFTNLVSKNREFSLQGEGDGATCAVVNQLWAWLFQK